MAGPNTAATAASALPARPRRGRRLARPSSHNTATAQTSTAPTNSVSVELNAGSLTGPPPRSRRQGGEHERRRPAARAPGRGAASPPAPRAPPRPHRGPRPWRRSRRARGRGAPAPGPVAMPQGTKRVANRATRNVSRIASASSTRARSGPAYSRTMASWIIVSSRWVLGLSTGRRPHSATMTITRATTAKSRCGLANQAGGPAIG